jgi:NAD(P)-dependent dehydrogenase (short-subunit alcohol dehydrogenase family)
MRHVLVTGAGNGIGRATAEAFVRSGDAVVAAMRDPTRSGGVEGAETVPLDVCDDASVAAALASRAAFDVVVNNAGISLSGPVETIEMEAARQVFETNYWGAVRVVRAVLEPMRTRRSGIIINVSTVGGRTPSRGYHAFYQGSKHALRALSEALVWELEPFDIRVALVEPGFVDTGIFEAGGYHRAPPASPYADDEAWVRRFFLECAKAQAVPPTTVADEILAMAAQPHPELHHPVGPDAIAGVAAARSLSFEAWYEGALDRVASMAGPRPTRASRAG